MTLLLDCIRQCCCCSRCREKAQQASLLLQQQKISSAIYCAQLEWVVKSAIRMDAEDSIPLIDLLELAQAMCQQGDAYNSGC